MHAYKRIISETILIVSSVIWCTNVSGTLTTCTDITQFIVRCNTYSVDTVKQFLFATTFLTINSRWTGSWQLIFATRLYPHTTVLLIYCNYYGKDWFVARNICHNETLFNLAKISCTQIKVWFTVIYRGITATFTSALHVLALQSG